MILSLGVTNNNVAVTWSSAANLIYQLQSNTNVSGTNWVNVPPQMAASGPTTTETNAIGSALAPILSGKSPDAVSRPSALPDSCSARRIRARAIHAGHFQLSRADDELKIPKFLRPI